MIEAPLVSHEDLHPIMLMMVTNLLKYVKNVAIAVQPTIRRTVQRADWIGKWNEDSTAPFKFTRVCSCAFPSTDNRTTHITYYVGATANLQMAACNYAPSTGQTREHAGQMLGSLSRYYE